MSAAVRNIIAPPRNTSALRYRDGLTRDIITVILDQDALAQRDIRDAEQLRGRDDMDTLRNVFNFVKRNVRYRADRPGKEVVKNPAALFDAGVGDCKSFSIAIVSLCRALGFRNLSYRFAAYAPGDVTHVYPVCYLGGEPVILDAVFGKFNREAPYDHIVNRKAARAAAVGAPVAGVSPARVGGDLENGLKLAAILGGLWLAYNFLGK